MAISKMRGMGVSPMFILENEHGQDARATFLKYLLKHSVNFPLLPPSFYDRPSNGPYLTPSENS